MHRAAGSSLEPAYGCHRIRGIDLVLVLDREAPTGTTSKMLCLHPAFDESKEPSGLGIGAAPEPRTKA